MLCWDAEMVKIDTYITRCPKRNVSIVSFNQFQQHGDIYFGTNGSNVISSMSNLFVLNCPFSRSSSCSQVYFQSPGSADANWSPRIIRNLNFCNHWPWVLYRSSTQNLLQYFRFRFATLSIINQIKINLLTI